jgi:crotonobetainyl-CoA:carnitine CoA-transferase CaiB-like acyl-CoA transferase
MLLCLYLFGLKTVHPESKNILKELDNRTKLSQRPSTEYDRSKLYGLYRTDDGRIMFEGSTRAAHKYIQSQ